ncbi:MAG: ATP synthase F0 subunit B [Sedimentisphaerales bacterium]
MNKKAITASLLFFAAVSIAFGAEQAASEEQQNIFNGAWADALWVIIAFAALLAVLSKLAWKPMLKVLTDREDHIKKQVAEAEAAKARADQLLDEYKKQGSDIIEQSNRYATQTKKEIIEQASKEAAAITQRATSEISNVQLIASQHLWHMAGNMLLSIGHEVIGRTITPEDNKRLIHEAIGKLQEESLNK